MLWQQTGVLGCYPRAGWQAFPRTHSWLTPQPKGTGSTRKEWQRQGRAPTTAPRDGEGQRVFCEVIACCTPLVPSQGELRGSGCVCSQNIFKEGRSGYSEKVVCTWTRHTSQAEAWLTSP